MSNSVMRFAKGMGLGLIVGCMAGAVGNQYMHSGKKGLKKSVGKALKNMGELAEEVSGMF